MSTHEEIKAPHWFLLCCLDLLEGKELEEVDLSEYQNILEKTLQKVEGVKRPLFEIPQYKG